MVIRWFLEQLGVDFTKIFSHVVKTIIIRVVITLALFKGWKICYNDICNASLSRDLIENMYMTKSPEFDDG